MVYEKISVLLVIGCSMFLFDPAVEAAKHTKDSLETVRARVEKGEALLIDVRELDEWNQGRLTAARFVPLSELHADAEKEATAKKLPQDKIIYCHCRSGRRVLVAAKILNNLGYDIRPLKWGYAELVEAGFDTK